MLSGKVAVNTSWMLARSPGFAHNGPGNPHMRRAGQVKFFNKDKGFGFISPDDGGRDIFVHVSTVQRAGIPWLEDGMRLSFDIQDDSRGRGPQAVSLQLE